MLTGEEKVINICNNDICNYLGNSLAAIGACKVKAENNPFLKNRIQKIILIKFNDDFNIMLEIDENRNGELSINDIKEFIINKRNSRG